MSIEYESLKDAEPSLWRDYGRSTADLGRDRSPTNREVEITDVQTTMVAGNYPWTLVRVYTDAGVVGTGEAYWGAGVPATIEAMKPFLVGENPLDVDRLYEHLVQRMSGAGSLGGVTVTAISGVEVALHDLAGKLLDLPAYQLLGGKYRDTVRVYCDTHAGAHLHGDDADDVDPYAPAACAAAARTVVDEGFEVVKFDLDTPTDHGERASRHLPDAALAEKVAVVDAIAEELGDDAQLALDCHWTWSGESALRLARALEPYDLLWLEDPVPPENHDVQRVVTRNARVPIASGENVYRKHGARRLIEEQAVDVVHVDMPKVGGMRETRKIADAADTYYMPVALHNVCSPVGTVAGAHVAAALPDFLALEYHARDVGFWGDIVEESVLEDGRIVVPEAPGLGVTLDLDAVAEHVVPGETVFDEA